MKVKNCMDVMDNNVNLELFTNRANFNNELKVEYKIKQLDEQEEINSVPADV